MNLDTTHTLLVLLGTTLGGGVLVHFAANVCKRLFGLKTSSVIHTLVVALSALGAGAQYIIQIHSSLPPVLLGFTATTIYGVSQLVYRYSGYASNFLGEVRAYNASIQPAEPTIPTAESVSATTPLDVVASEPAPANF